MKAIVDTCVWSLALRRNVATEEMAIVKMLRELITDGRVVLLGAIRQEVLSEDFRGELRNRVSWKAIDSYLDYPPKKPGFLSPETGFLLCDQQLS